MSTPTTKELVNASMAFLSYAGESLPVNNTTVFQIAGIINKSLPTYPNLNNDWRVVWGPALHSPNVLVDKKQSNLTMVLQSQSQTSSYIVATRGTVGDNFWEWLAQDLAVVFKPWPASSNFNGGAYISKATANALKIVLNTPPPTAEQTPAGFSPLPGAGQTLAAFLETLTRNNAIELCFTGHSLGGAIAPAMALWFKQTQGNAELENNDIFYPMPAWDSRSVAAISCVSLAGPTPGDKVFSEHFEKLLGDAYDRIYNTYDVVPHAFAELDKMPGLYKPSIKMSIVEKRVFDAFLLRVRGEENKISSVYTNLTGDNPFTCPLDKTASSYAGQALYQHIATYELQFKLPLGN
jgi:hypothetical protein